jgi:hypothetical protein
LVPIASSFSDRSLPGLQEIEDKVDFDFPPGTKLVRSSLAQSGGPGRGADLLATMELPPGSGRTNADQLLGQIVARHRCRGCTPLPTLHGSFGTEGSQRYAQVIVDKTRMMIWSNPGQTRVVYLEWRE